MTRQRQAYRGWAVAGLLVCGLLSLLALAMAATILYFLVATRNDGLLGPKEWALLAFYMVGTVLPFWGMRVFWRVFAFQWVGDRDLGLSRSAWRLIWSVIAVTVLVTASWLFFIGVGSGETLQMLAVHWGIVLPPVVILIILTRIVSPIGREEQVAHVF